MWAIVVGLIAAWLFVTPIAFNEGALSALHRKSHDSGFVWMTPYPQLYDDRPALYASAIVTIIAAFAVGLPLLVRRVLTWWTVVNLLLAFILGICLVFIWVPRYLILWTVLAAIATLGSTFVSASLSVLRRLAAPASSVFQSTTFKLILVLVAIIEVFLIIPAASGAYVASNAPGTGNDRLYLFLYMKDPTSPIHEEVVELVAATTDYLVVKLSDRVPHPRHELGPTTLPVESKPGAISLGPFYFPMLVRRDSIEIIAPSLDPEFFIDQIQRLFWALGATTQPQFKIGREGAVVKVWTEYPTTASRPSSQPGGGP